MLEEMPVKESKEKPTTLKQVLFFVFFTGLAAGFLYFLFHTLSIVRD